MAKLTPQRQKFVDLFIKYGNQTKAYMEAYPKCKNNNSARASASQLLTTPSVSTYYQERLKLVTANDIADANEVLRYFTGVMRGDIRDQFNLDASLQDRTEAAKQLAKRMGLDKQLLGDKNIDLNINIVAEENEEEQEDE